MAGSTLRAGAIRAKNDKTEIISGPESGTRETLRPSLASEPVCPALEWDGASAGSHGVS
jgi:hypothetical protein